MALAQEKHGVKVTEPVDAAFVRFSAETRVSGITIKDSQILKGAGDAIAAHATSSTSAIMGLMISRGRIQRVPPRLISAAPL